MTLFLHLLLSAVLLAASATARAAPDAAKPASVRGGESIDVTVRGTLRSGVVAIGAETTGVTITANGIVWDVELRQRFVVKVRSIKAGT